MDDADRAQAQIERHSDAAVSYRRPKGPVYTGECHYCGEPVQEPMRWCGRDCRDMWERLEGRYNNGG